MILGIVAGKIITTSGGGGGNTVSWVNGTEFKYLTGTTTISQTTPAEVQANDLLLAFVSSLYSLTVPSGWTLVSSIQIAPSSYTLSCLKKDVVTNSDASASFSFTQSSASRIMMAYAVIRSSTGNVEIKESATQKNETTSGTTNICPTLTANSNEIAIITGTNANALSPTVITPPSGSTLYTGNNLNNYRMYSAYQLLTSGQSNGNTFTLDRSVSPPFGSMTIRIGAI